MFYCSVMIRIPSAGGYDKLVYSALPVCGFTEGVNIKQQGSFSLVGFSCFK